MSLTTPELLKVIDQLKDYVAIAKQRNDIINDDKPYPIEKRIDLLRINNQANDSMQKILSYLKKGQVWCLEINNQKEGRKEFQIRGSASSLRWSSDSKKLAFVSNRGDHSFIGVYDFVQLSQL